MPRALCLLVVTAWLLAGTTAYAGDPTLEWRTIETEHFVINYYEPNDDIARRVAVVAEHAHRVLSPVLRHAPSEKTIINVTDDTDGANGFAGVLPRNAIGLFATAPDSLSVLNDHDDWLYGLVAHEYSHILHLDTIGPIEHIYNKIVGKSWAPNDIQPRWFIEGLATYEESRRTSSGRTRSAIFDMYLRLAVLAGKPLGLDEISSGPLFWPHGHAAYLYGSAFLKYIADRFGDDKIADISHNYGAEPIPYGLSRAVTRAVGEPYDQLYGEWLAQLRARYELVRAAVMKRGLIEGRKLTNSGEYNTDPRWLGQDVVWQQQNGREHGGYYRHPADGSPPRLLVRFDGGGRYGLLPDGSGMVVERSITYRTYYSYNDLYLVRWDGSSVRLSHGARLLNPRVSPDGRSVVAVMNGGSQQKLVVLPLEADATPTVIWQGARWDQALDPDWSPDGSRIVFAAWTQGGYADIYVYNVSDRTLDRLTADRAIDVTPTFGPDGHTVYFASDRTGVYNLYTIDVDKRSQLRQLTNVLGGAFTPAVSRDGHKVVYEGFDGDGYEIYELDLDAQPALEPEVYVDDRPDPVRIADDEIPPTKPRAYRAAETLGPLTYTLSTGIDSFGSAVTVATSGSDAVGLHAWYLSATYGERRGDVSFGGAYYYSGLWPSLALAVGRSVGYAGGLFIDGRNTAYHAESWGLTGGVNLPVVREPDISADMGISYELSWLRNLDAPPMPDPNMAVPIAPDTGTFGALTLRWSVSNVRGFVYTLGPVEGRGVALTLRLDHKAFETGRRALQLFYRWDEYLQLPWWRHVAAIRLQGALGASESRGGVRYYLGGAPQQDIVQSILNSDRVGTQWLHGYPQGSVNGSQYHLLNFEYRVPVVDIEKGVATLPFYFRRLHLAGLVDLGGATDGTFGPSDVRWAVGAAVRLDMTFGFYVPGSFDLGFARGLSRGGDDEAWLLLTGGF